MWLTGFYNPSPSMPASKTVFAPLLLASILVLADAPPQAFIDAQKAYNEGAYEKVIALLNEAEIVSNNSSIYRNRARAHFKLGNLEATINDYTRAIENTIADKRKQLAEDYKNRGQTY